MKTYKTLECPRCNKPVMSTQKEIDSMDLGSVIEKRCSSCLAVFKIGRLSLAEDTYCVVGDVVGGIPVPRSFMKKIVKKKLNYWKILLIVFFVCVFFINAFMWLMIIFSGLGYDRQITDIWNSLIPYVQPIGLIILSSVAIIAMICLLSIMIKIVKGKNI